MSDIDIAYGAARRSEYLNRKFAQVISPGPKSGFNVRKKLGFTVQISQVDEPGVVQSLVTPEGVVIHEEAAWTADVLVPIAGGDYNIICRYTHGPDAMAPSYLYVDAGTETATDTILATVTVLGGELSLLPHNIKEAVRQRNRGTLWPTVAVKDENTPVAGQMYLPCSILRNIAPASFPAGVGYDLPAGVATGMMTEACVPPGVTEQSPVATIRVWFSLQSFVANGIFTARIDWLTPPAVEGEPPLTDFDSCSKEVVDGADNQWWYVEMEISVAALVPGRPLRIGIERSAEDTLNATARLEMIQFTYQRSCIGKLYSDMV